MITRTSNSNSRAYALLWTLALLVGLPASARSSSLVPLGVVLITDPTDAIQIQNINGGYQTQEIDLANNSHYSMVSVRLPGASELSVSALTVLLPASILPMLEQTNYKESFSVVGGTGGDDKVQVTQWPVARNPAQTFFLFIPAGSFGTLQSEAAAEHPTALYDARISTGETLTDVTLVALDPVSITTSIPAGVLQQLNPNLGITGIAGGLTAVQPPAVQPITNGDAFQDSNGLLRLTPDGRGEVASAWIPARQSVVNGFQVSFDFQITNLSPPFDGQIGGDGFAFVIQNIGDSVYLSQAWGGYLGYEGLPDSLAVEFDTYWNQDFGDPSGNHISIHTGGTGPNSVNSRYSLEDTTHIPNMKDGNTHHVSISYTPGNLQVFLDDPINPVLNVAVDLNGTLRLDPSGAYVGFTAGTYYGYETNLISNWSFTSS